MKIDKYNENRTYKTIGEVAKLLKLVNKKYLSACANITGGGLEDNIKRIIPKNLIAEINLNKIKFIKGEQVIKLKD